MQQKEKINIVWFKKDLRLRDHAALAKAISNSQPVLLLYCFEPSIMEAPDSNVRHHRFAYESLCDLQRQLEPHGHQLYWVHAEVIETLAGLAEKYAVQSLLAHEEVGTKITFDRDRAVKRWCVAQGISYGEFPQNGIQRGKQNRIGWEDHLEQQYFIGATEKIELTQLKTVQLPDALLQRLSHNELPTTITTYRYPFQRGGETYAWQYFKSFLQQRYKNYSRSLSKPDRSRKSCSRLSPYLAFGCISSREVYQNISVVGEAITSDWNIKNFRSRLWWRSHYLQKLESWWRVEMQPINPAFNKLDRQIGGPLFEAWAEGRTGFPMVDASMRCLQATGWINFRMRAMLVTFASFALWLDWRPVAAHLARLFLDYDPGIHYPQIQMQAGLTGYHTLRIFNPTVQVREHDANGNFILQWLPELSQIPKPHLAEPWKMTSMEQTFYEFEIGKDYPAPIVDYDKAVAANKDRYWAIRQNPEARRHLPAIWQRFCIPSDIEKYQTTEDVCNF